MAPFGARSMVLHGKRHPDSPKGATMPKRLTVAVIAVATLAAAGTAVAQTVQRFSDVPPDHEAHEAIEWAAEVGVTTGYPDGTFGPEVPLSKRHAVVFMERYYDNVLQADESPDFTRGDMMVLLRGMASKQPEPDSSDLFGDPYISTPVPPHPPEGMLDARVTDTGAEFKFGHTEAHSGRDLDKWPVRGWLKLICNTRPGQPGPAAWFVMFDISSDADRLSDFEGVNVSLDGGPVRGLATRLHGHIANTRWVAADDKADAFVSWIAEGFTLKVITRYLGEGVSFDVSGLRLYTEFLPPNCTW